jgi:hypothetical protein
MYMTLAAELKQNCMQSERENMQTRLQSILPAKCSTKTRSHCSDHVTAISRAIISADLIS